MSAGAMQLVPQDEDAPVEVLPGGRGRLLAVGGVILACCAAVGAIIVFVAPPRAHQFQTYDVVGYSDALDPSKHDSMIPECVDDMEVLDEITKEAYLFEYSKVSAVDPKSKEAIKQTITLLNAARRQCEGSKLPDLPFTEKAFEQGAGTRHRVHVQHKYALHCAGSSFKLHFYTESTKEESMSFVVTAFKDKHNGVWEILRTSPPECNIKVGGDAYPEILDPGAPLAKAKAEFAATELTYRMRQGDCLQKSQVLVVDTVEQVRSIVEQGALFQLMLKFSVGGVGGASSSGEKFRARLDVLEACGKTLSDECVNELRLPQEYKDACAVKTGKKLRRLSGPDGQGLGFFEPDATELHLARRALLAPKRFLKHHERAPLQLRHLKSGNVPESHDLRSHECFEKIPVYDQGSCGSCYAQAFAQMSGIRKCLLEKKGKKGAGESSRRLGEEAQREEEVAEKRNTSSTIERRLHDESEGRTTVDGCKCKKKWTYEGQSCSHYCCNPNSAASDWCVIDQPSPSPSAAGSLNDEAQKILDRHNVLRCMHGVPSLTWNAEIAQNAQKWADETGGEMRHSSQEQRSGIAGFPNVGENLYSCTGSGCLANAVDSWYGEIKSTTDGRVSSFDGSTGHYTQVVWKATSALGCGFKGGLVVCQYGKGGNMDGEFEGNVAPPIKTEDRCKTTTVSAAQGQTCGGAAWAWCKPKPAPSPSPSPPACVDSTEWKDSNGEGCPWYAENDKGCTKYRDYGQRTHCKVVCGTCPTIASTKSSNPWKKAPYEYMPSVDDIAQCAKDSRGARGCDGGNTNSIWDMYMKSSARAVHRMGDKCLPYKLKCWKSDGVVNPLSGGECSQYDGYEKWHKPCTCIDSKEYPTAYQCPSEAPSEECGFEIPYAAFQVASIANGLTNAEAVANIQRHIHEYGPVYIAFATTSNFMSWPWRSKPVYTGGGNQMGGHAVTAVGWGAQDGVDFWLLRNSWGNAWADQGYCKFQRGINLDQIEASEITATMPEKKYKDATPPTCQLKTYSWSTSYSGTELAKYDMNFNFVCSKKANLEVYVSKAGDSSQSTKYTAIADAQTEVSVTAPLACLGYGLQQQTLLLQTQGKDDAGNVGTTKNTLTINAVDGMTSIASCA